MSKILIIAVGVSLVLLFYGLYNFVRKYGFFDLAVASFIALSLLALGAVTVNVSRGDAH